MPIQECQLPVTKNKQRHRMLDGYVGDAEFNESDHPRDNDGKFSEGGGGEGHATHEELAAHVEKTYPGVKLDLGGRGSEITLSRIVVPKESRSTGVGSKIMKSVIEHADAHGKTVTLSPSSDFGGNKTRLVEFYKRFGFVENKGRNKDLAISETMYRLPVKPGAQDSLAFDRVSVRTIDQDGHLHVAESNISMAAINPYMGREIPDWRDLGLDPDKVYQLFRDPLELAKGAKTFDGKPLLFRHKPTDAQDHATDLVVGAVYNSKFDAPFLKAELVVWPGKAIDAIETGAKQELSCGYRYKAVMTPGVHEGKAYDGIMTDIEGNHVALVEEGRAGPDVVVGDSNGEIIMAKTVLSRKAAVAQGALLVYLRPKLAQDAKIDLTPVLSKITSKNFKDSKPGIIAALIERTKGKLAQDAALDDAGSLLDSLEALDIAEDEEAGETEEEKCARLEKEAKDKKAKAKDEWPDKDDDKKKEAEDEDDDDDEDEKKKKAAASDKSKKGMDAAMKDLVTKSAMNEAIKEATANAVKTQQEIRDAERAVRPYVGDLPMAHDSAITVYRAALDAKGIDTGGINELVALKRILELQPKPSDQKTSPRVAMDAAGTKSFYEMFPEAARIRLM